MLFLLLCVVASCGSTEQNVITQILFTDPLTKISETSSDSFTELLFNEASTLEPLIKTSGTQVNMGFWSAANNHGNLVRVLDSINYSSTTPTNKAIWDEGAQSSLQYPAYVTMTKEHWYERANTLVDGKVTIYGVQYTDPHPVTFEQADQIWGLYSERYTEMARLIKLATGKTVNAWCFVNGAKANRIFFMYEYPALQTLESEGVVTVYFAKNDLADWTDPNDWDEGTNNAPSPAQVSSIYEDNTVTNLLDR